MTRPSPSTADQQTLNLDVTSQVLTNGNGETTAPLASFKDPAFATNKTLPVHRWIPWIAGFSSAFARGAIERHLSVNGVVLDPFCGVGTTLVEGVSLGHNVVGFEINPYAALASSVKVNFPNIDADKLTRLIAEFELFYNDKLTTSYKPKSLPPEGFKTRAAFYSPKVLKKVLLLQDYIATVQAPLLRDVFRLVFASTMVQYSNYSYEPSLARRVSSGKQEITDFPVADSIVKKLKEIVADLAVLQATPVRRDKQTTVINDSFFQSKRYLEANSIDLVVTSPPYLNNYHYNRNTRPHLYWLGYAKAPTDFKHLEESNFGKYWQTVREEEPIKLTAIPKNSDIQDRLDTLRAANPDAGIYGGNGWANYAVSYFNDCFRFSKQMKRVLKKGSSALVVLGNSILQGVLIPTDEYFAAMAQTAGLEVVNIHKPRSTRVGNSIIQSEVRVKKAHASHQLYESVVEVINH